VPGQAAIAILKVAVYPLDGLPLALASSDARLSAKMPSRVVVVVIVDGLVGLSPPHPNASAAPAAPIAQMASRRPISLLFMSFLGGTASIDSTFAVLLE
jgi:hypothetical protein